MGLVGKRIVVDERPFMIWEDEQINGNLEFIKNIDPAYFYYIADINYNVLKDENESGNRNHAALCIRIAYSHALETLFAFLFAALQAPHCIGGWLKKYQIADLGKLITKVNKRKKILSKIKLNECDWEEIAKTIHKGFTLKDEKSSDAFKEQFAVLWRRFANDFMDDNVREEYNSLKHGFRINSGGFGLSLGIQDAPDIPAPAERMETIGYSQYGSTFPIEKRIRENEPSFRLIKHSRNWEIENYVHALNLISISLNNIQSFLRIANGDKPSECKATYPGEIEYFMEPWKRISGVYDISLEIVVKNEDIPVFTGEEILEYYNKLNS